MKLFLALWMIAFSMVASAQQAIIGDGRFYAADEDSLGFVKAQLHYQAVKDVLTKELKAMGLDEQLFWRKYDERFNEYFKSVADQVKAKYADESGEVPKDKKQDYEKALRARRLGVLARYGNIQSILSKFSVKRSTRSPQVPQSRFYQIEAITDRRLVNELYLKFTSDESISRYQTLYVSINFNLVRMSWTDAGVEVGSDFTTVVRDHWRKWLEEKLQTRIDQVVFTDDGLDRELRDFLLIPRDLVFNQRVENSDSSLGRFASSIWLKIDINMEKLHDDQLLSKREIAVDGDILLIDLKTNRGIYQAELLKEKKDFHTEDARSFSSALASMVYSKPLPFFEEAHKDLASISRAKNDYAINISSLGNIQDLLDTGKLLMSKGVVYQARTEIAGFSGKKGTLALTFRGDRAELSKFLKGLSGQSIGNGKILQVNPESPTEMMIMLVDPASPAPTSKSNKSAHQG